MFAGVRLQIIKSLLIVCLGLIPGCGDTDPPRSHYRDLGTEGTILLPTGSPWKNSNLKNGQAEWHPFRQVGSEPVDPTAGQGEADGSAPAEIEAEIRDLIAEYNELVAEGGVDDLLEFFVEDQVGPVTPFLEAGLALSRKHREIREALVERLPDAGERIAEAFATLGPISDQKLVVESMTVVSETEVTGQFPAGRVPPNCRFVLIDEDWYVELPGLPDFAEVKPTIDMLSGVYDGWLQAIQSDPVTAESVLKLVEQQAQAVNAAQPPSGE